MSARHVVVVDVETTGLDPTRHTVVEVAWWDLTTDQRGYFIPAHDVATALAAADPRALEITRYVDRIEGLLQDNGEGVDTLRAALAGNTLAGSNPSFDAAFLNHLAGDFPVWHHRMWDLSAYAAGVLGVDHLPGLSEVSELLGIGVIPDHTASGDVTVTGLCFRALFARTGLVRSA